MASTKPTKTARWATDANRTLEPAAGEKNVGWEINKKPPARKMNWLHNITYTWFRWFDERFFDGATSEDLTISPPTPAAAGGNLITRGGTATAGAGGDSSCLGGGGGGAGTGGSGIVAGGAGGGTGAGGDANVFGGNAGAGLGGAVHLLGGGSVGTDQDGSTFRGRTGLATGDGSASATIEAVDANQGAGADVRAPEPYLTANGATAKIETNRDLMVSAADKLELEAGAKTLGDLIPNVWGADDVGSNAARYSNGYFEQLNVIGDSPSPLTAALEMSGIYRTNTIGAMAKIDFDGLNNPVLRTPHHNVASIVRTAVGDYDITLDFALNSDKVFGLSSVGGVWTHWIVFNAGAVWTLRVTNNAGGADDPPNGIDGGFCLIGAV